MDNSSRATFSRLFWPAFFESLLLVLVSIVDVIMVSMLGDTAVGAVGTTSTYLTMVITMLMIMSYGTLTVMTQNIGAGHPEVAFKAKKVGTLFNCSFGLLFTLIFGLLTGPILSLLSTSPALYDDAVTYMSTVGLSCVIVAVTFVYSSFLRSFGHARLTMIAATVGNAVNIALNWIFIKAGKGVFGIALATVIARCITLVLSVIFASKITEGRHTPCSADSRGLLRDILRIGLPAAGESVVFHLCTSLVIICINRMDSNGCAASAYSYINQLTNLIICVTSGISGANTVIVGWYVGEKSFDKCMKQTKTAFRTGLIATFCISLVAVFTAKPLIGLISGNAGILALVTPVMAINILREIGRTGNDIYGTALKAAGDALATLRIGVVVMPLCALFGGYLLGLRFGLGLTGAWVGVALDEFIRSVLMKRRWDCGAWQTKSIVRKADNE